MGNNTTIKTVKNETLSEMYYHVCHKSGLDIYVFPKKMTTAYALFGTRYGSIDNCFRRKGDAEFIRVPDGIAHFLEHKMFEAEDGSDTNERFTRLGAAANAFTSNDMTAYEFSCTENFYPALAVLLDYVTHPYFTEENIAKEQGIIGQEIGMYDDNPNWRTYYELLRLLYARDNIRINVCGTVESIAQITPEHLYGCYNTFYRLSNMALVICGDVDVDRVIAVADDQLSACEDTREIESYFEAESKEVAGKRSEIELDVGKTIFAIGVKDVSGVTAGEEAARRRLTMRILSELLFGVSGEFYNSLYNDGLINASFGCGYESTRTAAFFLATGETDDPEEVYSRFIAMLENAKKNPPSEADFARIKRVLYAEYVRAFDSTEGIAGDLLSNLFAGVDLLAIGDILSGIGYRDAVDLLSEFFEEKYCVMSVIRPSRREDENA